MNATPFSTDSQFTTSNITAFIYITSPNGTVSSSTLSLAVITAIAAWNNATFWMAAIVCPVLLVVGVVGNIYASIVLIALRSVQKNPAILTIIIIGAQFNILCSVVNSALL